MTPQQEREWREHPPHQHVHSVPGVNSPVEVVDPPPILSEGIIARWRRRRECRRRGGHYWHPTGMIDWFCCQCPALADGSPRDGTSGW